MRIAVLCPSFGEYGGIGRIAEALGAEFAGLGHELALISRPHGAVRGVWAAAPRLEIPMPQLPRRWRHVARQARFAGTLLRALPQMRTFIGDVHPDVLLMLGISTFAPWAVLASAWVPVVISLQGGEPDGRFAAHPLLFRWVLGRSAGVTACAVSLGRDAVRLAPAVTGRLEVVPNGVDPEAFADAAPYTYDRPYVLAAGRFTRQKGFDVLLAAAARLPAIRDGRAHVLFAGDGVNQAQLEQQSVDLRLQAGVHFLGPVEPARLASLYQGARVVAVPSRWEGLPLVCLEAMASGRPVVASRVDGIPDAVLDGETGLLVPPDDPEALARALRTLLDDPGEANRLGRSGRLRARRSFAWPSIARRYVAVLERARSDRAPTLTSRGA